MNNYLSFIFLLFIMYSTLRSPLFSEKKITIIYTAIYRKKKSVPQSVRQNDRFFHSKQSLRIPLTKALFISDRSSIKHKRSICFISRSSLHFMKENKKHNNLRTTAILLRPHPSTNRHTPCKPHGNSVLLQKI